MTKTITASRWSPDSIRLFRDGGIVGHVFRWGSGWRSSVNSVGHRHSRKVYPTAEACALARWNAAGRDAVTAMLLSETPVTKPATINCRIADALRTAIKIADEAREEWDKAPSDMRAGKLLIALSGHLPGYRADIDEIFAALAAVEIPDAKQAEPSHA